MARCLIVGCGCRGRLLAGELRARGLAVRGTTRSAAGAEAIAATGAEAVVGDPDRVATLARALDHVSVACILLGSAVGPSELISDLHGSRLEMLLQRMLDTTIRGIVYEAAGSVDESVLRSGAALVGRVCEGSLIPFVLLRSDPSDRAGWVAGAVEAVESILH